VYIDTVTVSTSDDVRIARIPEIGMIYIKGYLYPISYPKIVKKDIPPLSLF
jgi:hypothetical protein